MSSTAKMRVKLFSLFLQAFARAGAGAPLDDGESARYRPNDTEGSELGFQEALHLVKIEYCDRTRAAYIEDLFNRKQISHSVAVDLLEWVRGNPINS